MCPGCMLHVYQPKDAGTCLASRHAVFIGDSVTRKLFFQFSNIVDSSLPTAPPDDDLKHTDHLLVSKSGVRLSFYWDPFLNSSHLDDALFVRGPIQTPSGAPSVDRPALLVLGSGLWYLRYSSTSGGLSAWEAKMESVLDSVSRGRHHLADETVILPIEDVVVEKLSHERASTMLASDRDAMNSDLYHRIHPSSRDFLSFFSTQLKPPASLPIVFNEMLDSSQTEDGLHFSDAVVRMQANVLLNMRCNDELPKYFPLDKTCCRSYPWPSILQLIILAAVILWGPYSWFLSYRLGKACFLSRLPLFLKRLSRSKIHWILAHQRRTNALLNIQRCHCHHLFGRPDGLLVERTEAVRCVDIRFPQHSRLSHWSSNHQTCRQGSRLFE